MLVIVNCMNSVESARTIFLICPLQQNRNFSLLIVTSLVILFT